MEVEIGHIFDCEIKNVSSIGNGLYSIYFEIVGIQESNGLRFESIISSNWGLTEVLNYYKFDKNIFQVEFNGINPKSNKPQWILRKINTMKSKYFFDALIKR